MPDDRIISKAKEEERTIVTHDLDFGRIVALSGRSVPSIVTLRLAVLATRAGEVCGLVPIRKLWWGRRGSRCENERFSCKVQEIKGLRGGVPEYAARGNPQSDDEIAKKRRFWTRTG